MSDGSPFEKEVADLLPFEDDSAAPGQIPAVLGEVEPDKFLYVGKGLTPDEFSSYVQSYNFGKVPPDSVVLHHTANPCTLAASYPAGHAWDGGEEQMTSDQSYQKRLRGLLAMREFYRVRQQWIAARISTSTIATSGCSRQCTRSASTPRRATATAMTMGIYTTRSALR